ncbi:hypothetical protein [Halococcus salifodinae]|uniref:hypothetical protein n=1 Tax=Halococcus salifodinae TaxID=36738 RepID=UPI00126846B6|nr:hypothetical protein [Halococcus salifodinae]
MSSKDADRTVEAYQDELSEAASDGSGCAEMWSTLSDMREGSSDHGQFTSGRRGFISRVAMTLGVIPIGATATASASSSDGPNTSGPDSEADEDNSPDVEEVHGETREQLVQAAHKSEKVAFVAEHIGEQKQVASVFKYTLQSGTTGYGVTLGVGDKSAGPTIRYYESDAFEDQTSVVGGKPAGDGVIAVDADNKLVLHVHGTPQLRKTVELLSQNEEYTGFKQGADEGTVREDEAVLVYGFSDGEERTDILLPVEKNGKMVDRLVLSGSGWPNDSTIQQYSAASSPSAEGPIQTQIGPCPAICTVLTAAGAFGCTGVCLTNPVTAPFASLCGQLCSAVAVGTCLPTCRNLI